MAVDLDEPPPCPPAVIYLLHWFADISRQRQPGTAGVAAISWSDLRAWAALYQRRLTRFEIRVLTLLDTLYRAAAAKAAAAQREQDRQRAGR